MAKYSVIYFTRTNNSKQVAEKIADQLSCSLIQVTDNINWKGIIGFIKAGFYSKINKHVEIQFLGDLEPVDEVVIVGPIWARGLAPAMKTLLSQFSRDKVHLVVSSIESHVEDRSGYLSVHDVTSKTGNEDLVIGELVSSLLNG